MTSIKISALPAAADLTGAEQIPVVQDGATVRTPVSQIRAGLAAADLSNVTAGTFASHAQAAGLTPPPLSTAVPAGLGTAAAGTAADAARGDHVHPLPSPAALGAAAASHGHAVADTAGLQAALDAKLAMGKDTLWVRADAFVPRATGGAGRSTAETSTNCVMRSTVDFDPATPEYAQTTVTLPKSWNRGTVTYQIVWLSSAASGVVAWVMRAVAVGDGDALDAGFGSPTATSDAATGANTVNVTAESGPLTIAGAPQAGDVVVFQLHRAAADPADTLAVDAQLLGVRIFYTKNAPNDA